MFLKKDDLAFGKNNICTKINCFFMKGKSMAIIHFTTTKLTNHISLSSNFNNSFENVHHINGWFY